MKITSVDVMMTQSKRVGMSRPVLVCIHTDAGIDGFGEAGATFTYGSYAVVEAIKEMAKQIIGMDPTQNEVLWQKLFDDCYWTKGNGAILFSALSAIDIALWDIRGKDVGKPVHALLGGKFRDSVRCYASQLQFGFSNSVVPQYTLDDYQNIARVAIDKGYDAIKVDLLRYGEKPGNRVSEDEAFGHFKNKTLTMLENRMRAIREAVGPDVDIILENHCCTTLNTALQVARRMEPYNIMYMEEPITPLNPDLTRRLHEATSIPLTNGERTYLREGFLPFFHDRSLDMIQPDLGLCGGITEGKKICDMANAYQIGVQAHVCGTPISVAAGLHLESAIPNFTIHETHVLSLSDELLSWGDTDFTPVGGRIAVPDTPGLGVELTKAWYDCATIETVR